MTAETKPHIYVEQSLQLAAVRWLSEHRGYAEAVSDHMATGDRVDSVGLMAGRVILVEVKPVIRAGMSRYLPERGGTIESKISGALNALHGGSQDRLSTTVRGLWDPVRPLVVAILAGRYNDPGLAELLEMLEQRSSAWLFDYRVWHWTGEEVAELAAKNMVPPPDPAAYSQITIEPLVARVPRKPPRSRDELRAIARDRGVGELVDHVLRLATTLGYRIKRPTRGNFDLYWPTGSNKSRETVIGLYIEDSNAEVGLNVGCWRDGLGLEESELPGLPAPRKGFLNTNRYLRTIGELTDLLQLFAGQRGNA